MKLLLGECIDRRLARDLTGHETKTVPQMGRAGKKNGELLRLAESEFDIFVTADRNLSFQQHLPQFDIAVIVLSAASNRLADLRPLAPKILDALPEARAGGSQPSKTKPQPPAA
ncbi:MAG: DUF5615 family PIN-like protein [Acidobacteria bacterium]|nr:DUF5615 family PIN-like protein [Acidobacteriota bacterium]